MFLVKPDPLKNSVKSFTLNPVAADESNYGRSKTKCLLESQHKIDALAAQRLVFSLFRIRYFTSRGT